MTAAKRWTAPAKVNLYLHVLGRRDDGYHDLDSLVVFPQFGDVLDVAAADELRLTLDGPFADGLPDSGDNLVLRAAALLADAAGVPAHAAIRLRKNLPVAAGIGGGSADAAAALRALAAHWRLPFDAATLQGLAGRLGADVPVCLCGRPARIGGIGHRVRPIGPMPSFALLLANPGLTVSTAAVFQQLDAVSRAAAPPRQSYDSVADLAMDLQARGNDLEAPARRLVPSIDRVIGRLGDLPGCRLARMSGSGATCFGLFDDLAAAGAAAAALAEAEKRWWLRAAIVAGTG
ncbi:MAG: 4-(cytidine 5'-diphospho)-2-C-methyl-D-erythritol kinase [Alphaproteobacteria bacterium]|jgi:4-diphosphocytidyl-2-C-methyl-D-erythritol kinase|nr:4-(cytidine 5'-diphospho)-2-C-methyl-D-erythritol kinase [Rhodospirillaceae bacterium]MDP6346050.1 4-(cytidine 5'-diphospho)-2-C-methyl-D-erythritol kinase [Alphaproteobacteria bacterium]MDP6567701.1 4-(cytidine 5'-diphospho)-2-C-methyl-D-erythritol kinase [Alphaproteobacteria bacterium]MDP6812703.1 4-(cytidine 5'-diphospho)-2-C-methyl-D-erythritol kinase [Alphaproteobacteria bacterium]